MEFSLTEEQQDLQREIIRFARGELTAGVIERDQAHIFSRELWLKCGEMGLLGLPVETEYGGSALDPLSTAIAIEAFGYGSEDGGLVFSACAHLLACVVPLWKFGSDEQKRRYLPDLCSGRKVAANAMSEPGSGSDAFALTTRADPDGHGYRLNGTKTFVSNGPIADLVLVFAATERSKGLHGGITAFLIDAGTQGLRSGQTFTKMGLRTSTIGEMVLEDVCVPAHAVLGKVGAGASIFNHSMEWERICLSASHLGTMQRLLETSVRYARTRSQFGQTIGKYQAVSHRIADMKVRLEAARQLIYKAASKLETSREVSLDASIAKLYVSESLVQTARDAVQLQGGYGYMAENNVERVLRDALASTLYSGTSEIQRNIISRWLGL